MALGLSAFVTSRTIFCFHCLFEKLPLGFGNLAWVIFAHMIQILAITWHSYQKMKKLIRFFIKFFTIKNDSLPLHKPFLQCFFKNSSLIFFKNSHFLLKFYANPANYDFLSLKSPPPLALPHQ